MRLRACKEAGLKQVPIIKASELTEDQQREFIIKDNVGFGEWDWEVLANEWDQELLDEWALDLPSFSEIDYSEKNTEIGLNDLEDQMVIKLQYTAEDYARVREGLSRIAQTPEQAVFILLGYDEEV